MAVQQRCILSAVVEFLKSDCVEAVSFAQMRFVHSISKFQEFESEFSVFTKVRGKAIGKFLSKKFSIGII